MDNLQYKCNTLLSFFHFFCFHMSELLHWEWKTLRADVRWYHCIKLPKVTSSQTHENRLRNLTVCVMKWLTKARVRLWLMGPTCRRRIIALIQRKWPFRGAREITDPNTLLPYFVMAEHSKKETSYGKNNARRPNHRAITYGSEVDVRPNNR